VRILQRNENCFLHFYRIQKIGKFSLLRVLTDVCQFEIIAEIQLTDKCHIIFFRKKHVYFKNKDNIQETQAYHSEFTKICWSV
jgi:hypothetical protein